jgi:tRNA threonylcarbamoyladenosine biosynthesis protein TsaE
LNDPIQRFQSDSPDATFELGSKIAKCMTGGMAIALIGPIGAGKTLLVKGIAAENAGSLCEVTSPTFTLVQEYPGRLTLFHMDVYRLPSEKDPLLLGLDEMVRPDSVLIVEWADRVVAALNFDTLWVEITPGGETRRQFAFRGNGPLSQATRDAIFRTGIC